MRIMVAGAAGFIGSHLCERFIADAHQVIAIDDFSTGEPDNLAHLMGHEGFTLLEHDASRFTYVESGLDGLFHLAQPSSFLDYQDRPLETLSRLMQSTLCTLDLARRKEARYVLASTGEVYGTTPATTIPETEPGVVDPLKPRGIFAEAKRLDESVTTAYRSSYGLDTRIARIFDVYGPGMRTEGGSPIANFVLQALSGDPLTVYGEGQQVRSFCYVDDLVDGLTRLFFSDHVDPVNLGGSMPVTIGELAQLIIEVTGSSSELVHLPLSSDDVQRRLPDLTRARESLGWAPQVSLRTGLELTVPYLEAKLRTDGAAPRTLLSIKGFL